MAEVDVIIPAGGKINPAFARVAGTTNKALIRLEGTTVLANTLQCLRSLPGVNRIVVIGDDDVKQACGSLPTEVLPEQKTGPQNIFSGLRWLQNCHQPAEQVLIVTSDLPFLTPDVLANFISLCPKGQDFCVPLISKDSFEDCFPAAEATFVRLRDGTWTTGCAYLATPKGLFTGIEHIEKVFENRKSKLGLARMLGPKFVYGYLTHNLTVNDVEMKVKDLLKCAAVAIPGSPAELAFDIDYIDDYHYALNAIKLKSAASHV